MERTIEDGEKEEGRPSAENMTTKLFEAGFEETMSAQSAAKDMHQVEEATKRSIEKRCLPLHNLPTLILALQKLTTYKSLYEMQLWLFLKACS